MTYKRVECFSEIPDGQAIISISGVYCQAKLAKLGKEVYAVYGSGYVRLLAKGITSHAKVKWHDVGGDGRFRETSTGVEYDAETYMERSQALALLARIHRSHRA